MDIKREFRFTTTYSAVHQERFLRLLEERKYREAIKVLDNLPSPRNAEEAERRSAARLQGYRHIAQRLAEAEMLRETEDLRNEGVYF